MTQAVVLAVAAAWCAVGALGEAALARRWPRTARTGTGVLALARLIGYRAGAPAPPDGLQRRIAAAGLDLNVSPSDVMAVKGGGALLVLTLLVPVAAGAPTALAASFICLIPAAAFVWPDQALRRRARTRAHRVTVDLADVLDLLRVAVASGLPIARALDEVGRRHPGLLAAELRRAGREMAVGVRRGDALASLAERCPVAAVASLVTAIARAERHGAPLAPTLAALAADARAERSRAVADHAARAAPKVQLIIALLLVPGVLLLVAAALLTALGS